jgi:hypothetical protein
MCDQDIWTPYINCQKCADKGVPLYKLKCLTIIMDRLDPNSNSEQDSTYFYCINCIRNLPIDCTSCKDKNLYKPMSGTLIHPIDIRKPYITDTLIMTTMIIEGDYFKVEGG